MPASNKYSSTMAQDPLEVIREEQVSPMTSVVLLEGNQQVEDEALDDVDAKSLRSVNLHLLQSAEKPDVCCACVCPPKNGKNDAGTEKLLAEKEKQMLEEFEVKLKKEIDALTNRFDFILRNEQIRASYMLSAANRERQEKIMALQTQLQCKNLAGLLYVMCSERRRSRLEKMRIVEEFTKYITNLHEVLSEAQYLILHLSLGYKTAARVDREWREKMTSIMTEFQNFVYNFAGGTPEATQYFFDLPKLLKTEAPIEDDPDEDPICNCEQEWQDEVPPYREKEWWESIEDDARPFVVFGDMGDFTPDQRRRTLKCVKAKKTAPKKWKEYVFNNATLLKSNCPNLADIKDEYERHLPIPGRLSCTKMQDGAIGTSREVDGIPDITATRRGTSMDLRGMGSILKMITQTGFGQTETKATLLGARDSMEIASTTKLKEKSRQSVPEPNKVVLNVGSRKSYYDDADIGRAGSLASTVAERKSTSAKMVAAEDSGSVSGMFRKIHTDSLEIIDNHVPEDDHKLIEKVCPMEACKRMHMSSFLRSLPSYMKYNPYTHFEQTYDKYQTCSPEQLEMIKARIDERKRHTKVALERFDDQSPLQEWASKVPGVAVQTSEISTNLPPCTCRDPNVSPVSSFGRMFHVEDLIPVKQKLNEIHRQCFFDDEIEFDRFKVLGMPSHSTLDSRTVLKEKATDFTRSRLEEIKSILKKHPSLCDIFQANTRC